jgi:uncharacterized protein HemX
MVRQNKQARDNTRLRLEIGICAIPDSTDKITYHKALESKKKGIRGVSFRREWRQGKQD